MAEVRSWSHRSHHQRNRHVPADRTESRHVRRIRPVPCAAPGHGTSKLRSAPSCPRPGRSSWSSASSAVTPWARSPHSSRPTSTGSPRPSPATPVSWRPPGSCVTTSTDGASSAAAGRRSASSAIEPAVSASGPGSSATRPRTRRNHDRPPDTREAFVPKRLGVPIRAAVPRLQACWPMICYSARDRSPDAGLRPLGWPPKPAAGPYPRSVTDAPGGSWSRRGPA